jgi:hypothetical protein
VVKEYMAARTDSITEKVILSAWKRSGIRPLDPNVFTEEDYAPSYGSSINPPLPVPFPSIDDNLDDALDGPEAINEGNRRFEGSGAEGNALMDVAAAAQLSMARGSLSTQPDQEINSFLVQPSVPSAPLTLSNETHCILPEEGRREPPDQPSSEQSCMQPQFIPSPPVKPPLRQTQSLSRSLSCHNSTSTTSAHLAEQVRILKESLKDAQAQIKDTQKQIQELEDSSAEWKTHCHFIFSTVQQLQKQLQAKEKKNGSSCEEDTS